MPSLSGTALARTSARLGMLRLGAGRLGYVTEPTAAVLAIGGVAPRMRIDGLAVQDFIGVTANTCGFTADTIAPTVGQDIQIGLGDLSVPHLLFAGTVQAVHQIYEGGDPDLLKWDVSASDYVLAFNRRKVRRRFGQQSATPIAFALVADAPGFTTRGIVADLPTVDGGIDYTDEDRLAALQRLAVRIGGYADVNYGKDVQLFLVDVRTPPDDLVPGLASLMDDPPVTVAIDLTNIRTRVWVEGGGSTARRVVAVGDTVLPVVDANWYDPAGGLVVSGPQRITYAGIEVIEGPIAPTATADASLLGLLGPGPYIYKIADVDASGEGSPGAASAPVALAPIAPPSAPVTVTDGYPLPGPVNVSRPGGGGVDGGTHAYAVTFSTAAGETTLGTIIYTGDPAAATIQIDFIPIGPVGCTARSVYRTTAADPTTFYRVTRINNNTVTTHLDSASDASILAAGITPPTVNNAGGAGALPDGEYAWRIAFGDAAGHHTPANTGQQFHVTHGGGGLSNIPVSTDPRCTRRFVYRTPRYSPDGSDALPAYQFEAEIPDNVSTVFFSSMLDSALGAAYIGDNTTGSGSIDLSGIVPGPSGTTARNIYRAIVGSGFKLIGTLPDNTTTIFHDNVADSAVGGSPSALIQWQLTGIPASGPGSVLYPILTGDNVDLCVQVDDVPAQLALAALEGGDSDGIVEYAISDGRWAIPEATANGLADLALFSRPIVTVGYTSRDPKTKSGKTVHIDLPSLDLLGDFTIQSVGIDQIGLVPGVYPRYQVVASSVRFSLEDVLRRLQVAA